MLPLHREGWVYAEKVDGDRMLGYKVSACGGWVVNKIEAGRYDPPLNTITALAKALKVKPAALRE
jgi:hypothetical protein